MLDAGSDPRGVDPRNHEVAALDVRMHRHALHAFQPKWCSSSPRFGMSV